MVDIVDKALRMGEGRQVKRLENVAKEVNALEDQIAALSDEELKGQTAKFKQKLDNGASLDDIMAEAFATVREVSKRTLGQRHFDVQLMGGAALHWGNIAEMKTGEGKTLVATLPSYLNALEGKGVHVITVNDYLASYQSELMGRIYRFLGMSVGCIVTGQKPPERRKQYNADITYGTNNEFGFDYLRDNMAWEKNELVQRGHHYAIVDEVDSILIDEARTPLIISGRGVDSSVMYRNANTFVKTLNEGTDYKVEEKDNQVSLTDDGVKLCEAYFKIDNFSDPDNMELNHYVHQALRANFLMKKDVDYIVKDGEILIVDEFTGRLMYGRRFSNGLHQAIEAKEGVKVRSESKTLATITLQNYFRMYNKLAGMTGTAKTEEDEFRDIYNMDVVVIPTNKPVIREDRQDSVYAHQKAKYKAIVNRVVEAHQTGQPVLVGTISIEISELISNMLKKRGVKHNVLNAKHHEQEAEIVAEAGRLGAVTIATNMAGRGTDIILGGNPDFEARRQMRKDGYTPEQISFATGFEKSDDPELLEARAKYNELHEQIKRERAPEQQKVKELGGLCIVGTERHESRRIDNQLRGRSGRQGDPGNTQFFIALEDDLMRLFGGERMQGILERVGMDEDEPLEAGMLSRSIEGAQKKVEGKNFGIRKYVLQYDNVMNKQREIIYDQRRMVLNGEDVSGYIRNMTYELIDGIVDPVVMESKYPEEWDFKRITDGLEQITPDFRGRLKIDDDYLRGLDENTLKDDIKQIFDEMYAEKEAEIGSEQMREVERMILLRVVDNRWMDHIDAMDQLKDGIGLRGIGQQDPAVAYAQEGFAMFDEMVADIREETVKFCYNVTVTTKTERRNVVSGRTSAAKEDYKDDTAAQPRSKGGNMPAAAPKADKTGKQETIRRDMPKVGRNDPCPCGSGKKYKNCCGRNA